MLRILLIACGQTEERNGGGGGGWAVPIFVHGFLKRRGGNLGISPPPHFGALGSSSSCLRLSCNLWFVCLCLDSPSFGLLAARHRSGLRRLGLASASAALPFSSLGSLLAPELLKEGGTPFGVPQHWTVGPCRNNSLKTEDGRLTSLYLELLSFRNVGDYLGLRDRGRCARATTKRGVAKVGLFQLLVTIWP